MSCASRNVLAGLLLLWLMLLKDLPEKDGLPVKHMLRTKGFISDGLPGLTLRVDTRSKHSCAHVLASVTPSCPSSRVKVSMSPRSAGCLRSSAHPVVTVTHPSVPLEVWQNTTRSTLEKQAPPWVSGEPGVTSFSSASSFPPKWMLCCSPHEWKTLRSSSGLKVNPLTQLQDMRAWQDSGNQKLYQKHRGIFISSFLCPKKKAT